MIDVSSLSLFVVAALQALSLGVLFVLLGIGSDGLYALLAGSARSWLRGNPHFLRAQRYVAGVALVALGGRGGRRVPVAPGCSDPRP